MAATRARGDQEVSPPRTTAAAKKRSALATRAAADPSAAKTRGKGSGGAKVRGSNGSKGGPARTGGKPPARAAGRPAGADLDGALEGGGAPAAKRALRTQGKRTMRRLLDAAMVAFDRRGYHATRVNDVVEIAKTSHGTFYLYFSNKEDLLRALVAEATAEASVLYSALTEPPEGGTASWEHLRGWIGEYSSLWLRYAPLFRAWTDLAAVDPELGVQVSQTVTSLTSAMATQIRGAGAPRGLDPDIAGMAVLAMLDRFHYMREFVHQPIDATALDTLTTVIHRALFDSSVTPEH